MAEHGSEQVAALHAARERDAAAAAAREQYLTAEVKAMAEAQKAAAAAAKEEVRQAYARFAGPAAAAPAAKINATVAGAAPLEPPPPSAHPQPRPARSADSSMPNPAGKAASKIPVDGMPSGATGVAAVPPGQQKGTPAKQANMSFSFGGQCQQPGCDKTHEVHQQGGLGARVLRHEPSPYRCGTGDLGSKDGCANPRPAKQPRQGI